MFSDVTIAKSHATSHSRHPYTRADWPKMPWQRIHIDFAGPFMGKMFLIIVVDSHSKWAISKIGNGESRNGERETGNGERGISKIGNI